MLLSSNRFDFILHRLPSLVVDVTPPLITVLKLRRILHTKFSTLPNNFTLTASILEADTPHID
jgi:hypothetical protein